MCKIVRVFVLRQKDERVASGRPRMRENKGKVEMMGCLDEWMDEEALNRRVCGEGEAEGRETDEG